MEKLDTYQPHDKKLTKKIKKLTLKKLIDDL